MDGFSAEIFAPLHANAYLRTGKAPTRGFRVKKLPKIWKAYEILDRELSRAYFLAAKPALVHETYFQRRRLAPKSCPIVLTVYDMIHEKFPDLFKRTDLTSKNKRTAVARADLRICISEHTRRDLIEIFAVPPHKTITIPLGFELDAPAESGTATTEVQATPYLLYVGNRHHYKNFDRLLRAYAGSPGLHRNFSLVAFGGPPLSSDEYALMSRLKIPQHKVIWERGSDVLLSALYRRAAAMVYPSLYEGFGIPPLEAMSRDCPVICSNTSSIPEVVGTAAVLFDPLDAQAIGSAIESVVNSESMRRELIARGRQRIKAFSWDRCASETAGAYAKVIG